jgi:hypothetical protein
MLEDMMITALQMLSRFFDPKRYAPIKDVFEKTGYYDEFMSIVKGKCDEEVVMDILLYENCTCIELDVVWVIPALLFAFLLSSLGSASLKYSMQAYRHGSKTEILTFILVIVTVIPGMLYTIIEQKISLDVYFFFPYNFLFVFAAFLKGYLAIFSFILAVTPVGVAYYLVNLLKKWEIRHVWFYFIWLFFLVIFALGVILAAVGLHPYPY